MTSQTTEPWIFMGECEPLPNDGSSQLQVWAGGRPIAVIVSTEDPSIGFIEGVANAHVMTAAQDLFAALIEMTALVESLQPVVLGESDQAHNDRRVRALARASLAKAKGEQR